MDEFFRRHAAGHYGFNRVPEIYVRKSGTCKFGVGKEYWSHSHLSNFRSCVSHLLYEVIGRDFFESQAALPIEIRHPLAIWHSLWEQARAEHKEEATLPDTGATVLFAMLAYHMYLLKDHGQLPENLINRLRNNENFQGARYEIFVAASMITCGYSISWLPHSSSRSVEFIATHRDGRLFAVEAKSRHRLGILKPGAIESPGDPNRIKFQKNIIAGIRKNPKEPLLLFVEANVPATFHSIPEPMMREIELSWTKGAQQALKEENFPCVGLVVTNDSLCWTLSKEMNPKSKPGWAWSCSGDHRHGFNAEPYLRELLNVGGGAFRIPEISWHNSNRDLPDGPIVNGFVELHE